MRKIVRAIIAMHLCLLFSACNGYKTGTPASVPTGTATPSDPQITVSRLSAPDPSLQLGSELLPDAGLEGEYDAGLNVNWGMEGGAQVAQSTVAHGGASAQQVRLSVLPDGTPGNASANLTTSAPTTIGQWYRASLWAKRIAGSAGDVHPWIYAAGVVSYHAQPITTAQWTNYVVTGRATATAMRLGVDDGPSTAASDTVLLDDVSLRRIPFPSMVALRDEGSPYGKSVANLTLSAGTQGGIVFCADSPGNPQNFLLLYHDGAHIVFLKSVGGVFSSLTTGDDFYYYNVANNPSIAYVPGAALEIRRGSASNTFLVYYNGNFVAQETVDDPAIVNNTVHGVFNSYEGNKVDYFYTGYTRNVVFLGGSITNGTGASSQNNAWQWRARRQMDAAYPQVCFTYTNAAKGATDSWYSLVRLQSDVLAYKPDIVFLDEAVNDGEIDVTDPAWPYVGEAIVRRLRGANPQMKIVICNFIPPFGVDWPEDANTAALRAAWNRIASYYRLDLYRFDLDILAALPANPTRAQIGAFFTEVGGVHPNDAGHAMIAAGLARLDMIAANGETGSLANVARLNGYSADYEATPAIVNGSDLSAAGGSGSWTLPGNSLCQSAFVPSDCCTGAGTGTCSGALSSTAGSTLTWTGPMTMIGLDVGLENWAVPNGLEYSVDGGPWSPLMLRGSTVWTSEFLYFASRQTHTITIRLGSGSATINRLLVL